MIRTRDDDVDDDCGGGGAGMTMRRSRIRNWGMGGRARREGGTGWDTKEGGGRVGGRRRA